MTAMLLGTALALIALGYVLYPLFRETLELGPVAKSAPDQEIYATQAIDALREIEFDHATGKLSESDYARLSAEYTQRAVTAMRDSGTSDTPICRTCGPRSESDARFCSECGRQLAA